MFTRNYIEFKKMMFLGANSNYVHKFYRSTGGDFYSAAANGSVNLGGFGDIGGNLTARCRSLVTEMQSSKDSVYPGVYFGSGSTPATKADYNLESPITSGLTISNGQVAFSDNGEGEHVCSCSYVITNTTSADVVIREVGVFTPLSYYSSSPGFYPVLMERTVLSEPITIPPGESKLVTYKITFNHVLNVE